MVPEPNERGLFVCITCVAFSGAFLFLVMPGSVLRFLYGQCCKPSKAAGDSESLGPQGVAAGDSESLGPQGVAAGDSESLGPQGVAAGDSESLGPQGVPAGDSESLGPQGASTATVGVSALAQDLSHFEITSQVPEALSKRVVSAKKAQAKWYRKLSKAWKEAKPPPRTPEEAARIVIQTLKKHRKADVEGLLAFYGLPLPRTPVALSTAAPSTVEFELQTLPVDAKAVHDGDTMTVYVSTISPRESSCIPDDIQMAARQCSEARAERNYPKADALHQKIIHSGYRLINDQNQDILARKYRIRLRGIDAPESSMPYGQQAKEELSKIVQGKCLRILVYSRDNYGRCIGDVYCNGMLVQEAMLKKGFAWQYTAYDQRSELASWEQEARAKQVGLWASSNPEKPWEWRKARRAGHLHKLPPPEV